MGKYGKKQIIKDDILSYNIGILGESGIGKSTLIKDVCEKLVGENGYLAFNIGKEDGHSAINGIVSENIENWAKFVEVTDDIITNKPTDYKDLKVIIIDTIDQLFEIAEPEVIRLHNVTFRGQNDKYISTINAAFGGFQAGQDKAIELVLDRLWELKHIEISFIVVGHTKRRDIEDVVTGQTYLTLTTNMPPKYFNAIKTKLHVLGVAYIDREIVKEMTGKKNAFTKEQKTIGKIKSEVRKITFRDDNYTIDAKSRFPNIIPSVELKADEFINALKSAIESAKSGGVPAPKNEIVDTIRTKFKTAEKEQKEKIRAILEERKTELENLPTETLDQILGILS